MVAGNQFTSSEHALQVAARAIESVHQSCDTIQNNVTNSKMSLAGGWTGNASNGFGGALETWQTQLKSLMGSLEQMGMQLSSTHKDFVSNEEFAAHQGKGWANV
ncbi:WXG100 family type VII secretion target [Streptomyces tubercidicus]|uniref:WXG100 family type VII secretion target n=1 Tax=Streptomyces tubercidicus TaxID=47759 RepID=UPI002E0D7C48|nr:WXG100 family type VII secretion target [Streptomyces tubercidicus]WSX24332.1 WXG100 family type VII secretion target [Streptomyces tubercidicus]